MKKVLIIASVLAIIISCSKNCEKGNTKILNSWLLIEQLIDPGDGSGVFVPVDSQKTIEFLDDGTVVSNGSLCYMNSDTGTATISVFDSTEKYIIPGSCMGPEHKITYEIIDDTLLLYYPCFEPCTQKFVKLKIQTK